MKFLIIEGLNKDERKSLEKYGLYCYQLRDNNKDINIKGINKDNNAVSMVTNKEIKFDNNKKLLEYKNYVEFIAKNEPVNTIDELIDSKNKNMKIKHKERER